MKILLTILGSLGVGSTPALATIATNPNFNQNLSTNKQDAIWDPPTSMEAVHNGMDRQFISEVEGGGSVDVPDFDRLIEFDYQRLIGNRDGLISVNNIVPLTETLERTFEETFTNDTDHAQTFQTHGYSETFTNTSTFSVQLKEDVSVEVKANFLFGEAKIAATFSSTQTWTSTETITETVTAPSQEFVVSPRKRGIVTYLIKSGTYDVSGLIRYQIPLDEEMYSSRVVGTNVDGVKVYKFREIIAHLNDAGYGAMMRLDSDEFSLISTDNPENPSVAYVNVPVSYISKGGKLDVTFTEEPLL